MEVASRMFRPDQVDEVTSPPPGSYPMRVGVLGNGHVGLITCLSLASIGHEVTGYDVEASKEVVRVNDEAHEAVAAGVEGLFGGLEDRRIALLGLAFNFLDPAGVAAAGLSHYPVGRPNMIVDRTADASAPLPSLRGVE